MTTVIGDEDPDIAGIRPGPQPLPEQWDSVGDDSVDHSGARLGNRFDACLHSFLSSPDNIYIRHACVFDSSIGA